jgi:hypothetical protein
MEVIRTPGALTQSGESIKQFYKDTRKNKIFINNLLSLKAIKAQHTEQEKLIWISIGDAIRHSALQSSVGVNQDIRIKLALMKYVESMNQCASQAHRSGKLRFATASNGEFYLLGQGGKPLFIY